MDTTATTAEDRYAARRAERAALQAERDRRAAARGQHPTDYDLDYRLSSM